MSDKQKFQSVPAVSLAEKQREGAKVEHKADHGPIKTEKSAGKLLRTGNLKPTP